MQRPFLQHRLQIRKRLNPFEEVPYHIGLLNTINYTYVMRDRSLFNSKHSRRGSLSKSRQVYSAKFSYSPKQ
jgi:hypothetical protein